MLVGLIRAVNVDWVRAYPGEACACIVNVERRKLVERVRGFCSVGPGRNGVGSGVLLLFVG